jgi:hypothetical protein
MSNKRYAEVAWKADDILTLRPDWTEARAEEWLAANERYAIDRIVELGWGVFEALLGAEGRSE